jgi:hypothetical protein
MSTQESLSQHSKTGEEIISKHILQLRRDYGGVQNLCTLPTEQKEEEPVITINRPCWGSFFLLYMQLSDLRIWNIIIYQDELVSQHTLAVKYEIIAGFLFYLDRWNFIDLEDRITIQGPAYNDRDVLKPLLVAILQPRHTHCSKCMGRLITRTLAHTQLCTHGQSTQQKEAKFVFIPCEL